MPVAVLADGHRVAQLSPFEFFEAGLGDERSLLALLPEVTFFTRYHDVFP